MPLQHSSSDAAFKTNVRTLMGEVGKSPHVQSREQALAIAYATKRRGKAEGGPVMSRELEEAIRAQQAQREPESIATARDVARRRYPTPPARADGGMTLSLRGSGYEMPRQYSAEASVPIVGGLSGVGSLQVDHPSFGNLRQTPFDARIGVRHRFASGGQTPWYVKQEARNMVHSGPIMSAVPGRTDKHNIHVSAGSYVLPADHVSSLGQGNTQAGYMALTHMFSNKGPYGVTPMKMGAKKKKAGFADGGGSRGDESGAPTPIVVAGGEYVLTPDEVRMVGGGDLKHGHEALDAWVNSNRKKHIDTLRGLPGPARK